jgi:hypothetical protein
MIRYDVSLGGKSGRLQDDIHLLHIRCIFHGVVINLTITFYGKTQEPPYLHRSGRLHVQHLGLPSPLLPTASIESFLYPTPNSQLCFWCQATSISKSQPLLTGDGSKLAPTMLGIGSYAFRKVAKILPTLT